MFFFHVEDEFPFLALRESFMLKGMSKMGFFPSQNVVWWNGCRALKFEGHVF